MTEEQENFYRHCTVIVDVIKYLFLELIEFYFKNQNFTKFEDFIRKYQHEIYHLCYYQHKCCNCPSGIYRQGPGVLCHKQMALLLDTSGPKLRCHKSSNPNCCCQVKPGITVQLLDISLARTLMVNYLGPQCAQERPAIDELVRIRNLSYGHATSGRMSNDEFKQSIETITNIVMILARLCNKETEIKQMLSDSLRQPLNPAVCTQLHTTLLQQIEREDKIEQDLKEIKNALEDQKSSKDVDISDTFLSLLGKQEVYEGQDARFECKVTTIKVQGKWYKDGDQICDSQNVRITQKGRELCLNIYGTGLHDRGEYSCVVNGRETKAFLDVRAFFTITLRDKSCYEGDTITFTCEVIDLLTTALWIKDGTNIDNGRYVIKPMGKTHQLTIQYANLCDSGCFGVDVNGRCRQASLEVKACFITDIKSISCIEGQNVSFSCLIEPRDAVIQWFHSNREIKSSEKYILQCDNKSKSLEIRNVDIKDSGTIAMRVKNCSRACTLDVRKCFLKELDSITITEGYDVQFACEVNCQKVIGTWYKDNEEIENSEKFVIQRSGKKNSLVVTNTSLDDNGTYSFKVHHKVTEASLDVRGYFRKNPTNATCKEGEVVHITCESIESCIPAQWCKDGMDIDFNNDKFSIKQNRNEYQLTIRYASMTDNGCYSVNVNGRIRMADVSVREYFTKPLKDINCIEGDNIYFSCKSIEPTLPAEWSKNKEVIKNGRCIIEHKHQEHRLKITNVKPCDSGEYCINVSGRVRIAFLNVKDYFTVRLNDITCKKGDTARFKCEVKENGMIVKWYKDNNEIQSDRYKVEQKESGYQLTIRNVDTTDSGSYSISVNDRIRTAFLTVEEYLSDMESESESDIKDREDHYINQQNNSKLIQRETTAIVVCEDFIERKHHGELNTDKYVDRSSIQLDKGNASAFRALHESESESDTPVIEVQYSSINKWSDKLNSQFAKRSERADLTSFAEDRTKTVGNTSIDQTNTALLKEATRISQIPPKTESSENKLSTKELALDSDIKNNFEIKKVLPTHRTTEPMLTSRRKNVDPKVKTTSKYKAPKWNIFTTLDDDKTGISTILRDNIVRQTMYDWFNNETKIQFQKPSIPWPSMHSLLPYKLRYLDEDLVDTPVVKTSSSPNDSTDKKK